MCRSPAERIDRHRICAESNLPTGIGIIRVER
jgi:hypothetical protein